MQIVKECVTLFSASCPCLAYWMRYQTSKNQQQVCTQESLAYCRRACYKKKKKNAEAKFTFIQKRHFWSRASQGAYSVCRGPSALRCLSGKSLPLMWLEDRSLFRLRLWRAQFICNGSTNTAQPAGEQGMKGAQMKRGGNQREEQTFNSFLPEIACMWIEWRSSL